MPSFNEMSTNGCERVDDDNKPEARAAKRDAKQCVVVCNGEMKCPHVALPAQH